MQSCLRIAASARVAEELFSIFEAIGRLNEPTRVQKDLSMWGRFVQHIGDVGLLAFTAPVRKSILGEAQDPGSLANCAASVTPGTREIPNEYMRCSKELGRGRRSCCTP